MSNEQQLGQSFGDATKPVDPSIQYADALMAGEEQVTLTTLSGQRITYQIGQEFNYGE